MVYEVVFAWDGRLQYLSSFLLENRIEGVVILKDRIDSHQSVDCRVHLVGARYFVEDDRQYVQRITNVWTRSARQLSDLELLVEGVNNFRLP